jgi:molybdate transport system ATP-binding protein
LASTVVVIDGGHVIEQGATIEVLERPRSAFAAALVGLNLLTGVRTHRGLRTDSGSELGAIGADTSPGGRVGGTISPSKVRISLERPTGSGSNALEGRVLDLEPRGDFIRVNTDAIAADISPALASELDLIPGMTVWTSFAESELRLYGL